MRRRAPFVFLIFLTQVIFYAATAAAIPHNSDGPDSVMKRAAGYCAAGKFERAIGLYEKLLAADGESVEVSLSLARACSWAGYHKRALKLFSGMIDRDPGNVYASIGRARAYFFAKNPAKAAAEFEALAGKNPGNTEVLDAYAQFLSWRGKLGAAAGMYERALALDPWNFDALMGLGQVSLWRADHGAALEYYGRAKAAKGSDPFSVRLAVASVYLAQGLVARAAGIVSSLGRERPEDAAVKDLAIRVAAAAAENAERKIAAGEVRKALDELDSVLRFLPGNSSLWKFRGRAELDAGMTGGGICSLRKAAGLDPGDRETQMWLASGLEKVADWAGALDIYKKLSAKDPKNVLLKCETARVMAECGEPLPALALTGEAIAADPDLVRARVVRAGIHLRLGDLDAAEDGLLASPGGGARGDDLAAALAKTTVERMLAARRASDAGDFPKAMSHYLRVLRHTPGHIEAMMGLAGCLSVAERFDEAIAVYERVLLAVPGYLRARLDVALNLSWKREYSRAISAYQAILSEDPSNADAAVGLARTISWTGRFHESIAHYRKALEIDPANADGLIGYANTLHWAGLDGRAARLAGRLSDLGLKTDETRLLCSNIEKAHAPFVSTLRERSRDSDGNILEASGMEYSADIDLDTRVRANYRKFDARTDSSDRAGTTLVSAGIVRTLGEYFKLYATLNAYRFDDRSNGRGNDSGWALALVRRGAGGLMVALGADRSPLFDTSALVRNGISAAVRTLEVEKTVGRLCRIGVTLSGASLSDGNSRRQHSAVFDARVYALGRLALHAGPLAASTSYASRKFNGYFSPTDFVNAGFFARLEYRNRPGNLFVMLREEQGRQRVEALTAEKYHNFKALVSYDLADRAGLELSHVDATSLGGVSAIQPGYHYRYSSVKFTYRW